MDITNNINTIELPTSKGDQKEDNILLERYLPVPLTCVPPEFLHGLKVFISTPPGYSLYSRTGTDIDERDYNRLLSAGIKYVYIPANDHRAYYNAIENSLDNIINDNDLLIEKKSEILYSTTMALLEQICTDEMSDDTLEKSQSMSDATISLIMNDPRSFIHLYNVSNHDFYTATHMTNVSTLLIAFAHKIGIRNQSLLNDIGTAGLLHDVGKIFVPNELLNSTEKLDDSEMSRIRQHVQHGVSHLQEKTNISEEVLEIISHHHEHMDGSGYPLGLTGEQISIAGRMLAVVDVFEAITAARPYRDRIYTIENALDTLKEMAPDHLDPIVVEAFDSFIQSSLLCNSITDSVSSFKYILDKLGNCAAKEIQPSGRKHDRVYFRAHSQLRVMIKKNGEWTLGPKLQVILYNISQSGLGILSMFKTEADMVYHVSIKTPGNKPDIIYVAKTIRCQDYGDGWYTIGMKFLKDISSEQVEEIYNMLK